MKYIVTVACSVVVAAGVSLASRPARAETAPDAVKPLALRGVMQEMERQTQLIVQGIAGKDWPAVAKAAGQIAEHPEPPLAEKLRIFVFIGTDLPRFKGHDAQTHAAAVALGQAAVDKDAAAAAVHFRTLQDGCNACHEAFRKPFVAHFYGKR